jgi:hypothetical protein
MENKMLRRIFSTKREAAMLIHKKEAMRSSSVGALLRGLLKKSGQSGVMG